MATRLDAFVLLPLLIAAHLFLPHNQATAVQEGRRRPGCSQRVVVAMGVALLSYLVISFRGAEILFRDLLGHAPIFLTREVAASVIEYFQVGEIAHSLAHNLQFYLLVAMVGTFGVALTVFVFIGFLKAVLHWRREEALILGFVFLSLVPLLTFTAYGTHYLVTLVPICMILAAEAIRSVASWLEHRLFPSGSEVAALTVTAGILCLVCTAAALQRAVCRLSGPEPGHTRARPRMDLAEYHRRRADRRPEILRVAEVPPGAAREPRATIDEALDCPGRWPELGPRV